MWLGTLEYAEKKMQGQTTKQFFLGTDYVGHKDFV